MTEIAYDLHSEPAPGLHQPESRDGVEIGRIPHIAIHAFCETEAVASVMHRVAADRHLSRARCDVKTGGIPAAHALYQTSSTPDLIILESRSDRDALLAELEALAGVCDVATKVVVIGHSNDISLYKALMECGVAEYVLAPVDPMGIIRITAGLYKEPGTSKLGKSYAFIGARGGVGSSVLAQNVAWEIARSFTSEVMLADLDLSFGTADLNFNVSPNQGLAEAIEAIERLDEVLLERLLIKRGEYLRLLSGESALPEDPDLQANIFDKLLDVSQASFPFIVLDLPNMWSSWVRKLLVQSDEVVITATPDLASIRNARSLLDLLKQARPNDRPPHIVLNQVGMPKRAEIKSDEFVEALGIEPVVSIGFEGRVFSQASNLGQMISEASPKAAASKQFASLAGTLAGRRKPAQRQGFAISRLWKS